MDEAQLNRHRALRVLVAERRMHVLIVFCLCFSSIIKETMPHVRGAGRRARSFLMIFHLVLNVLLILRSTSLIISSRELSRQL